MEAALSHPFWDVLTLIAVGTGLFAALLFVVRYQIEVGWTWWRHPNGGPNHFGRFLMIRKVLLSCLFALVLANRAFPGWTGREAVTALLMACFALQTFVPYRLLVSAQKAQEKQRQEAAQDER